MAPERSRGSSGSLRHRALLLLVAGLLAGCATSGLHAPPAATPQQIPDLEAQAAAAPTDVDVLVRLGAAYRAAGRLDDAQHVLERALKVKPNSDQATLVLGLVYDEAGEDSSAVSLYSRYLKDNPKGALHAELARRLDLVRRRALQASVRSALAREAQLANTPPQPRTVGIFPFTYEGSDPKLRPLGRALAEMLTTDLAQSSRVHVLERLRVQYLLDEMKLSAQQRVDPTTAARSGRMLGAAHVVQGVLGGNDSELVMDAVVVPVGQGAPPPIKPAEIRDPAQRFFDMEKQMALDLFRSLGIQLTPAEREAVLHRPTENLNALLAFGLGLEAEDAGHFKEAETHFQEAARLDPSFGVASASARAAQSLAVAQVMNVGTVVQQGMATFASADADYQAWLSRMTSFTGIESLLPGILQRDPVPELLGREGVGQSGATIDLIIRRPGGAP